MYFQSVFVSSFKLNIINLIYIHIYICIYLLEYCFEIQKEKKQ
jgi:hypothetical protein